MLQDQSATKVAVPWNHGESDTMPVSLGHWLSESVRLFRAIRGRIATMRKPEGDPVLPLT